MSMVIYFLINIAITYSFRIYAEVPTFPPQTRRTLTLPRPGRSFIDDDE
jgi:hypothetical protein